MIQYPDGLPYPQRAGYGFTPVNPMLRTGLQSGRARQRRQYSSTPTIADVAWRTNAAQSQLFQAWWEEVLVSGSAWFECPLRTDQGLMTCKARFVGAYQGPELTARNDWMFRAQLELFERPILRGGWALYAPEYILGSGLLDLAMNKEWPEA